MRGLYVATPVELFSAADDGVDITWGDSQG